MSERARALIASLGVARSSRLPSFTIHTHTTHTLPQPNTHAHTHPTTPHLWLEHVEVAAEREKVLRQPAVGHRLRVVWCVPCVCA